MYSILGVIQLLFHVSKIDPPCWIWDGLKRQKTRARELQLFRRVFSGTLSPLSVFRPRNEAESCVTSLVTRITRVSNLPGYGTSVNQGTRNEVCGPHWSRFFVKPRNVWMVMNCLSFASQGLIRELWGACFATKNNFFLYVRLASHHMSIANRLPSRVNGWATDTWNAALVVFLLLFKYLLLGTQ